MSDTTIQKVRFDERGLIPAIVQEIGTSDVIGLRYMDNESLLRSLKSGQTYFIDGNFDEEQKPFRLVDIRVNLDGASLTVMVERAGEAPAEKPVSLLRDFADSHRHSQSEVALVDPDSMEFGIAVSKLYSLIGQRNEQRPEGSYTSYLFNSGLDKILKKVAEEAGEVIIAAKNRSPNEIVSELADLFYHVLVLMVERDVRLADVQGELERRASSSSKKRDGSGPTHATQD
jgi:phosphoribosyl-ATP pyrophosphohydrolase/phosphoribosyl-AMP cyclohydrolase